MDRDKGRGARRSISGRPVFVTARVPAPFQVPSSSDLPGQTTWNEGWGPRKGKGRMGKWIAVVSNELCNGCRNCEMWCSFHIGKGEGFSPSTSRIRVETHPEGIFNIPHVHCDAAGCPVNAEGDPLCVEMCPTGTLIYGGEEELEGRRVELREKRSKQPLFKLIAPWKYPYPWGEWSGRE